MLDSIAFQSGIFWALAIHLYPLIIYVLARSYKVKIEQLGLFYDLKIALIRKNINGVKIALGWLPLGSYIKISGVTDDSFSNENVAPKPYHFRSKSLGEQLLILLSPSVFYLYLGGVLINKVPSIIIPETLFNFFKISYFIDALESGSAIWNLFYTNPSFLMGIIFLIIGISAFSNAITNIMQAKGISLDLWVALVNLGLIFLTLTLIRVAWLNFSFLNLIYFLIPFILTTLICFLIGIILVKILK